MGYLRRIEWHKKAHFIYDIKHILNRQPKERQNIKLKEGWKEKITYANLGENLDHNLKLFLKFLPPEAL